KASGIVLGENKHYLVTSRLGKLMREFKIDSFRDLLTAIQSPRNNQVREAVVNAMTTNETLWFRDGYPFEMLKKTIFPELSQKRPTQLKIWSAASSSGQEAYSISMTIQEYLTTNPGALPSNIQIIGTDISSSILAEANAGVYDKLSLIRGISEERKKRFFTPKGEQWEIRPEIKKGVSFRETNLANSFTGLGQFDLVFCRNVLIYFSAELKKDILNRIAKTMNKGGYLFLGGSESPTSYCNAFEMVRTPQGVVYRVKDEFAAASSIFNR
ncbi:MAG: protein-glutamate O-methyltransferase CheR, partial [Gammaproteobacteria bacterium]|nr:protein-glutamate O-methyltransferase CheR [Gammaproteobacteria bacterium]